ncbi:MAG: hypothetical protein U0X75_11310 [Acidobacteriota bacterium]
MNTLLRFMKNRFALSLLLVIASVAAAHAQQTIPPLPELQFAEIQAKEKFTGDRWSYLEGRKTRRSSLLCTALAITRCSGVINCQALQIKPASLRNAPGFMAISRTDSKTKDRTVVITPTLADFQDALKLTRQSARQFIRQPRFAMLCDEPSRARVNKMVFSLGQSQE